MCPVPVTEPAAPASFDDFATLLREQRRAAGFTQEALAERAGLSARGIQNLEGGVSRPYRDTARRLADALGLAGMERAAFLVAARPTTRRVRAAGGEPGPSAQHNLPVPLTSFVGRERELAELTAVLGRARLATLTGVGGVGKTRLAVQAATNLRDRYPDGVRLVELASLADPALVPYAFATALGVREAAGRRLEEGIAEELRPKRLLLLLDNCEHLALACATLVERLMQLCPDLRVLATSREPLGLFGEARYAVPPLAVPAAEMLPLPEIARCDAVALFLDRARDVDPRFRLTPANAAAVAEVCRRLDGIPLALELAAARLVGLSVEQVAARLGERFRLLTRGSRTALPRHQTLRAALDWSYDLLTEAERRVFGRLAVFAGGWSLEAAEVVGAEEGVASAAVIDLLERLVDKSLVIADAQPEGRERYRMLETIRQYAWERLLFAGEADQIRERHARYFLGLVEQTREQMFFHVLPPPAQLARLEVEHANLRTALHYWLECDDAEHGLSMALALHLQHWYHNGHFGEGSAMLLDVLRLPSAQAHTTQRADALVAASTCVAHIGFSAQADSLNEEALAIYRERGDALGLARVLQSLGIRAYEQGRYEEAERCLDECVALQRASGHALAAATGLCWRGRLATYRGEPERASAFLAEAVALATRAGNLHLRALANEFLGEAAHASGDLAAACAALEQALALYGEYGDQPGVGTVSTFLGRLAFQRGDLASADRRFREGLAVAHRIGFRVRLCDALDGLAMLAAAERRPERALRLAGAAEALRTTARLRRPAHEDAWVSAALRPARATLGPAAEPAWAAGQALSLDQAVDEALDEPRDA